MPGWDIIADLNAGEFPRRAMQSEGAGRDRNPDKPALK